MRSIARIVPRLEGLLQSAPSPSRGVPRSGGFNRKTAGWLRNPLEFSCGLPRENRPLPRKTFRKQFMRLPRRDTPLKTAIRRYASWPVRTGGSPRTRKQRSSGRWSKRHDSTKPESSLKCMCRRPKTYGGNTGRRRCVNQHQPGRTKPYVSEFNNPHPTITSIPPAKLPKCSVSLRIFCCGGSMRGSTQNRQSRMELTAVLPTSTFRSFGLSKGS